MSVIKWLLSATEEMVIKTKGSSLQWMMTAIFTVSFIYMSPVFAADISGVVSGVTGLLGVSNVSLTSMLENFSKVVPNFMKMVTAFAYVMGMYFIVKAILELKRFGESRTMMSQTHELKKPMIMLFVGVALLYLPSSVQTGLTTLWAEPNPYGYVTDTSDKWDEFKSDLVMIIQLIGTIAFIRGLIIFTHIGQGGQPGQFGKAMSHIIAGILCINIYQFQQAVVSTLALGNG